MGSPTSTNLPPPPPPRGPFKPSLHDLQYREMEIKTKLLEAQLMKATDPNADIIGLVGGKDEYVWDSKNLEWVHADRDIGREA